MQAGRQEKHVCGCEGTVAGKGSHTLAFVGWLFRFIFCLYAANLQLLLSFFRLCLTFDGMVSCGITKRFPISLHRLYLRATNARILLKPACTIPCVELNPPSRIAVRHCFQKYPIFFYNRKIIHNKNQMIMRKKSSFTIVEQAIMLVPEFESVVRKLEQQVTLRGQSKSTLKNYIRRIALFVVHFGKLPEQIDTDEINEFLVALARDPRSPSRSSFKHMVYGLRYYFRLMGMNKNAIALPSLKKEAKLPVVLNHQELKELFAVPTLLKQRIVLTLIYSAGLRGNEVINLKISDIDFERRTIHIRQSKYKKDRVVPLAECMAIGLRKYLSAENPHIWLFNGKEPDGRYSVRGLSWVMRENLKKTSITKDVNLHSLRHSYATHLLEQGVNIVTLKELLGHSDITTTMIYLHIAQCDLVKAHSPLDRLYNYTAK